MLKNTASQVIGAQMISATDGSAFTGSVTVVVTGDGGTQGGGGACTHEGNGYHTYAPSQAETNYDHVAFTFTGTGAIPATVQVYTNSATVNANVVTWLGETPSALSSGRVRGQTDYIAPNVINSGAMATTAIEEIQAGLSTFDPATDTVARVTLVDTVTTNTDMRGTDGANITAPDNASITAIKAKTDQFTFTVSNQVDANIQYVNDVQVTGTGVSGDEWGAS